ncbi:hypothetical protein H5410_020361 [Solanum commersonii]|uniref:Uncharacterized protein n=1 Tax=Solanum commersonii TaxID=4109 RepID=A0A9J5ZAZ1_SOLCO|nr:hypothetical protein H5410_020361 [Solanum commersonii]
MAAYSAVISLLQSLDERNFHELFHGHTAETLDSLRAVAEYFQKVLDEFEPGKIKSLEEKIRDAASEAEDINYLFEIKMMTSTLYLAYGVHESLVPHLNLFSSVQLCKCFSLMTGAFTRCSTNGNLTNQMKMGIRV